MFLLCYYFYGIYLFYPLLLRTFVFVRSSLSSFSEIQLACSKISSLYTISLSLNQGGKRMSVFLRYVFVFLCYQGVFFSLIKLILTWMKKKQQWKLMIQDLYNSRNLWKTFLILNKKKKLALIKYYESHIHLYLSFDCFVSWSKF